MIPPGPPRGPRDPGDAWVELPTGERFWGRFGAAGLLVLDSERGVLLQHRVEWSHFGGTWALPGGARHEGESALAGAMREAAEEAGVPPGDWRPRFQSVDDRGVWSYTTVVGDVLQPFEAVIGDPESRALAWVPIDEVEALPLHPAFAASWPRLRSLLDTRPALLVDTANVVGSEPNGWWRDRVGATTRFLETLAARALAGWPADVLGLPEHLWYPETFVVLEGQARRVTDVPDVLFPEYAPGSGDDFLVEQAAWLVEHGFTVIAVTSDRELTQRLDDIEIAVRPVSWLRAQLPVDPGP